MERCGTGGGEQDVVGNGFGSHNIEMHWLE